MKSTPLAAALLMGVLLTGCTSTKSSSTARTGVEQLLISNSVDQALDKCDFQGFNGQKVLVEEKYIDCVDKQYVIGSVRHRVARAGGKLVSKPEEAEVVLEIRSGGVGTDTSDAFVGIPEIALPGMVTLPEVRLVQRLHQSGTAKIALVAYDAKTMQLIGEGGISLAQSNDNNWFVFGVGPYQNGSIKSEIHRSTAGGQIQRSELPTNVAFYAPAQAAPAQAASPEEPSIYRFTSGSNANPSEGE